MSARSKLVFGKDPEYYGEHGCDGLAFEITKHGLSICICSEGERATRFLTEKEHRALMHWLLAAGDVREAAES